jgi:hypothetical protein
MHLIMSLIQVFVSTTTVNVRHHHLKSSHRCKCTSRESAAGLWKVWTASHTLPSMKQAAGRVICIITSLRAHNDTIYANATNHCHTQTAVADSLTPHGQSHCKHSNSHAISSDAFTVGVDYSHFHTTRIATPQPLPIHPWRHHQTTCIIEVTHCDLVHVAQPPRGWHRLHT